MTRNPNCTLCPLHLSTRNVCLAPRGTNLTNPRVVFVGDNPGHEEDENGQPFQGDSGKLLQMAIEEYGVKDYAITYAVKCRTPQAGDGRPRKPYVKEMRACAPYLADELASWKPEIVVPLGNVALHAIAGVEGGILKYAGRVYEGLTLPFKVFPIMHPALVLRDNTYLSQFESCFRSLQFLMNGTASKIPNYRRLSTEEATAEIDRIIADPEIERWALDFETTGLNVRFNAIRTFAICTKAGEAWWTEWSDSLREPLYRLILSRKTMVAQNAVFETKALYYHVLAPLNPKGWKVMRWPVRDSLLLHHLIDENSPHDLTYLSKTYTDLGGYDDAMSAALVGDPDAYRNIDLNTLGAYNAGDADACFRCERVFTGMIAKADHKHGPPLVSDLYSEVVEPCIFTVAHCELAGRRIDRDRVAVLHATLLAEEQEAMKVMLADPAVASFQEKHRQAASLADAKRARLGALLRSTPKEEKDAIRERIRLFDKSRPKPLGNWGTYPQGTFNPNSSLQVSELLFDFLGVPVLGFTDSKEPSAAEKYLRPVEAAHPFVAVYLQWKKANTLRQRYLENRIIPNIARDSYIYASYMIHGTETGRWASSNPNMQNMAPRLKTLFTSRFPGGRIVEIDFSQVELRLIAWATQCRFMLDAYLRGEDLHTNFAIRVLGREPKDKEERKKKGKTPNFGLAYCASAKRFSLEHGVPLEEAELLREIWHRTNPEVAPWMNSVQRKAERDGWVKGYMGRIRHLPDAQLDVPPWMRDTPEAKRKVHAKLAASNFPIQNLGSEMNAWAFSRATLELQTAGLKTVPLGATHDSMTFDAPAHEVETVIRCGVRWMTTELARRFPWIEVPLVADPEAGPSWGEMQAVTLTDPAPVPNHV